jgi:Family of unknown function (DUF6011)
MTITELPMTQTPTVTFRKREDAWHLFSKSFLDEGTEVVVTRADGSTTTALVGTLFSSGDWGNLYAIRKSAPKVQTSNLPEVPEGYYAVPSRTGNNDLDFFSVDRPSEGRWAGYVFVKRVIGGHVDTPVRGSEARLALEAIIEFGIEEAGVLYGREIGRCYVCNRTLTDDLSREMGIGPVCRDR